MTHEYAERAWMIASGGLAWFFGGFDGIVKMLLAFAAVDYITGFMRAYSEGVLSSRTGFRGIAKKAAVFLIVGTANVIDREMLGGTDLLRDAVCFFYIGNEGISILENAAGLGLPVPEALKKSIAKITDRENQGEGVR